jgi:hypothetical protein
MRAHRIRLICLAFVAALATAGSARAQSPSGITLSLAPIPVQVSQNNGSETDQLSGMTLGGMVDLAWRIWRLDVRYLEGEISSGGDSESEDIVEGELMFGVAPSSWLVVKVGPHIRSFVTPQGTERWFFWEARLGTAAKLGSPNLITYFQAWHVFKSDVDAVESYDSGNGLEGGIRLSLSRLPFYGSLSYRVDHSNLGSGAASQTVEQMVLAIGWTIGR